MKKIFISCCIAAMMAGAFAGMAHAGKIVVANDEWTLSDTGFSGQNDPGQFALNVASWFTGGGTGKFLNLSTNFPFGTQLSNTMTGAGHTWNTSSVGTFDWTTPSSYNGIFLAYYVPSDLGLLINYVNKGGNVYLAGGTGLSSEANAWAPFLNAFGLKFEAGGYNGIGGDIAISNPHPLFANVDHLYQDNGSTISEINSSGPKGKVIVTDPRTGQGLYAVYESNPVPEPATLLLFGTGIASLAFIGRRRQD